MWRGEHTRMMGTSLLQGSPYIEAVLRHSFQWDELPWLCSGKGFSNVGGRGPAPIFLLGMLPTPPTSRLRLWGGREQWDTCSDLFAAFEHFRSLPFPLFPTVCRVRVTQTLVPARYGRAVPSPSLSGMEHTVPVLICSLGLGHPPFSSKDQVSFLVCSPVSHSGAQS